MFYGVGINLFLVIVYICAAFHESLLERILSGCIRLLARLRIIKDVDTVLSKTEVQLCEYRKGAEYIKKNPRLLLYVLSTIIVQILSRLSIAYIVYRAFGLKGHSYFDVIALQAMLALAVESLPLPGAVGASETGFLTVNRIIFGSDKLASAMLLSRGISFYVFLLISGAVALGANIADSRRHKVSCRYER